MKTKKDYTRLQGILAVCSFTCGVIIASICLFVVPPPGDISSSAISIVSELLVLCGALLGIKVGFDTKMQRFEARFNNRLQNITAGDPDDQNNGED
jgi:hypothetical protein